MTNFNQVKASKEPKLFNMSVELMTSLTNVHKVCSELEIKYAIGGSVGLSLSGVDLGRELKDLDIILFSKKDLSKFIVHMRENYNSSHHFKEESNESMIKYNNSEYYPLHHDDPNPSWASIDVFVDKRTNVTRFCCTTLGQNFFVAVETYIIGKKLEIYNDSAAGSQQQIKQKTDIENYRIFKKLLYLQSMSKYEPPINMKYPLQPIDLAPPAAA